jgi:hypothetical protein
VPPTCRSLASTGVTDDSPTSRKTTTTTPISTSMASAARSGLVNTWKRQSGFAELDADGNRCEIVFGDNYELLGYQVTLVNPDCEYAPRGTLISWTAYLARQWADRLPPDAPAIPHNN